MRWRINQPKHLIIAAIVLCIAVMAAVWWHERRVDPVIEGKRLSEWLASTVGVVSDGTPEERFRSAGENAVPLLLSMFEEDECSLPYKLRGIAGDRFRTSRGELWLRYALAAHGFALLGTNGQKGAGKLAELVDHQCTQEHAIYSLAAIKSPVELKKFLSMLDEPDTARRVVGLRALARSRLADEAAYTRVFRLIREEEDPSIRAEAIPALCSVGEIQVVIPAQMEIFKRETNDMVRASCLMMLAEIGIHSEAVESFLTAVSREEPRVIRDSAKEQLSELRFRKTQWEKSGREKEERRKAAK